MTYFELEERDTELLRREAEAVARERFGGGGMARNWCKHYRGMADREACEAGVRFDSLEYYGTKVFRDLCPCFGSANAGLCNKSIYPTAAEMAAEDAANDLRWQQTVLARQAIVAHLGGPWKRGMASRDGAIDCPVCGFERSLVFSRSGYNGHIHATCETAGCVNWME